MLPGERRAAPRAANGLELSKAELSAPRKGWSVLDQLVSADSSSDISVALLHSFQSLLQRSLALLSSIDLTLASFFRSTTTSSPASTLHRGFERLPNRSSAAVLAQLPRCFAAKASAHHQRGERHRSCCRLKAGKRSAGSSRGFNRTAGYLGCQHIYPSLPFRPPKTRPLRPLALQASVLQCYSRWKLTASTDFVSEVAPLSDYEMRCKRTGIAATSKAARARAPWKQQQQQGAMAFTEEPVADRC